MTRTLSFVNILIYSQSKPEGSRIYLKKLVPFSVRKNEAGLPPLAQNWNQQEQG